MCCHIMALWRGKTYFCDGVKHEVEDIRHFQDEETRYAEELSAYLGVPLWVQYGSGNFAGALDFIKAHITSL